MADLNSRDRRKLERLFDMGGGYVLNFSNRTFSEFFLEFVGKDIDHARYEARGTSKANRLRSFWEQESNALVAKCIHELIEHARSETPSVVRDEELLAECLAIQARLSQGKVVADIEAIRADDDDRDFELVAAAAVECIEKNQPELGLDRLHTFLVKFVRKLCEERGLLVDRSVPLNGLFGAYVKNVRERGQFGSQMTEQILKSSIGNLEQFNHVRNKHSLAHDNPILDYDEALLIFNYVASSVRFVKSLESRLREAARQQARDEHSSEFDQPF
jgi:hypothetical protein